MTTPVFTPRDPRKTVKMDAKKAEKTCFRAMVFDLDDTLFPERDYVLSGFKAAGEWLKKEHGLRDFFPRAKQLFDQGSRGRIFDEVLAQYAQPLPPDIIGRLVAVYRAHTPEISLAPEVSQLLGALRESGVKTGVLTDGFLETQKKKVEALGLAPLVDEVVYSDAFGRAAWKPAPRPFREMETALGVKSADCLYIGDNPTKDFLGARNAGWRSLRLRVAGREHCGEDCPAGGEPDWEVSCWRDLSARLNQLRIG
jgi:putative hydrolase of the HAD superfamily